MSKSEDRNYLPPSPQFWGNKKIKVFQSPPELGDLGGLDKLQHRQKNFQSKLVTQCVTNLKQKYKKRKLL